MTKVISSSIIKAEAQRLGFFCSGVSKAERVSAAKEQEYLEWLSRGFNAQMEYLANNLEKRFDPRLLVEGTQSIISVALNYAPSKVFPEGELQIAYYALGQDYHDVVKDKLRQLAEVIGAEGYRVFCDSAPVMERYWAEQSGLGWIGKNQQLIIPKAGSMFFLGEIFLQEEVDEYDTPMKSHCGNCHKCIDACPTKALAGDMFNAELCLSYQTIENRGELSDLAKQKMGDMFYGCDRCQLACPWNSFATPTEIAEFIPNEELMTMTREKWENLSEEEYRRLFKGSAVKRAKYCGLMRNIRGMVTKDEQTIHGTSAKECGTHSMTRE